MIRNPLVLLMTLGLLGLFATGCSDDGDSTGPSDGSEFAGYDGWNQVELSNAPNAFLGAAHEASNPEYTRRVYSNADRAAAPYDEGTLFVKETYTYDAAGDLQWAGGGPLLGMAKRAEGFDAEGGDWEYFMLDPETADVVDSGVDLMGGACKGCHTNAAGDAGEDFIFTHPTEFVASGAEFADYASWNAIGNEQGPDALLGAAHAGNDADAVRTIYKKQLAANPSGLWGYPVGTMLAKEVRDIDQNIIGMTALVKRGAGFDPDNGDWEYFVLDTADYSVEARGTGAEVMGGMCVGCHNGANSAGNGMDYVFAHDGDPFNN